MCVMAMDRITDRDMGQLWTIDVATGSIARWLTARAGAPRWSPDGTRIVYPATNGAGSEIRVLYLDTGRSYSLAQFRRGPFRRGLVAGTARPLRSRCWYRRQARLRRSRSQRRKGRRLERSGESGRRQDLPRRRRGYLPYGANQVFVLPVEGGTPRQVTSGEAPMQSPAWLDERHAAGVRQPGRRPRDGPDRERDLRAGTARTGPSVPSRPATGRTIPRSSRRTASGSPTSATTTRCSPTSRTVST